MWERTMVEEYRLKGEEEDRSAWCLCSEDNGQAFRTPLYSDVDVR